MRTGSTTIRVMTWIIAVMLVMPIGVSAQDAGDADNSIKFSKKELTQMLAPIALYPDSLTAQILMAATYPLEIVEAERWLKQNNSLKGTDLDNALLKMNWDPSVASLCHFPNILNAMSTKLDQTRKLGDAFLRQQDEVMATIQELRHKAEAAGTLKSTKQQKVVVEDEDIRIEPVDQEVVYVPVYDPLYVYGPWWYPDYPPYYWYYPPGFVTGAYFGFGPGIYLGFDLFSWCWFDWRVRRIDIDFDRTRRFHRQTRRDFDDRFWRHNPYHRRGVAYRDRRTSELFGARPPRVSPLTPETRGFPVRPSSRANPAIERRGNINVPQTELKRQAQPDTGRRREDVGRPLETTPRSAPRDTTFRGVGEGNFERRAVERGGYSIRSSEIRQPGVGQPQGGGFRGGEIRSPSGGFSRGGLGDGSRRERR
jgi:hypothetical protein